MHYVLIIFSIIINVFCPEKVIATLAIWFYKQLVGPSGQSGTAALWPVVRASNGDHEPVRTHRRPPWTTAVPGTAATSEPVPIMHVRHTSIYDWGLIISNTYHSRPESTHRTCNGIKMSLILKRNIESKMNKSVTTVTCYYYITAYCLYLPSNCVACCFCELEHSVKSFE